MSFQPARFLCRFHTQDYSIKACLNFQPNSCPTDCRLASPYNSVNSLKINQSPIFNLQRQINLSLSLSLFSISEEYIFIFLLLVPIGSISVENTDRYSAHLALTSQSISFILMCHMFPQNKLIEIQIVSLRNVCCIILQVWYLLLWVDDCWS